MPRPYKFRWVGKFPDEVIFKPLGYPIRECGLVELNLDEMEALRQAHLQGKDQEEGAEIMGISRSTFGRILENAHQKLTEALINRRTLIIRGGPVIMDKRHFECKDCNHQWEVPFCTGRPEMCTSCSSNNIHRTDSGPRGLGICRRGQGKRSAEKSSNQQN
jgi:uncharacterized protein